MPRRLNDRADAKVAIANSVGAVGPLVATKVNLTGYSRARFVFNFGANAAGTGALSAGVGIWQASTSGAVFAAIAGASLAAVTSGVLSSNAVTMVIDVPVSPSNPWLQVSGGSMLGAALANSCIVEPYSGVNNPPTSSAQQLVVI